MLTIFLVLFLGACFGFFLEKSNVAKASIIIKQMLLKDFTMLKVFLSAITTSMAVYAFLVILGMIQLDFSFGSYNQVIIGGIMFGLGVTLAGGCPGTLCAQLGSGYKDAFFALIGGIVGALFYLYVKPYISDLFSYKQNMAFHVLLGLPFEVVALLLSLIFIGVLFLLRKTP